MCKRYFGEIYFLLRTLALKLSAGNISPNADIGIVDNMSPGCIDISDNRLSEKEKMAQKRM